MLSYLEHFIYYNVETLCVGFSVKDHTIVISNIDQQEKKVQQKHPNRHYNDIC